MVSLRARRVFLSGDVPLSAERLEELRMTLSFVTFCLETYSFFFDRFLHQGQQAEIVAINRQTAP
jgi:hypothetical protein